MVLLVSTVPVAADPPPWAVESPAAAEARFGLGLDYLFEHQESLRIDSQESVVALSTEDGGTRTDVVHGDPDLLNRKFDLEWELKGPGVSVPLALSSFRLTDLIEVFPTLTLEAASVDVTLDSISKTELNPRVSLEGRGSLFGTRLGVIASLCGDCPWFNGTTYHYRSLPAFEADRSPTFAEPGFEVLHDEVRLSQEVHEVSTKFGYIAPNKRVAYYTGVRTRWTDVEIEDELRLRSLDHGQRTSISSRTRLDSHEILAVAGVDVRLGGSFFARSETAFSGQDYGVQVAIVYIGSNRPRFESADTTEEQQELELRAAAIAAAIEPLLASIEADFERRWQGLQVASRPDGSPAYLSAEVLSLVMDTERAILSVLRTYSELEPLGDWVQDQIESVLTELESQRESAAAGRPPSERAISFASFRALQPSDRSTIRKSKADDGLRDIQERPVGIPRSLARERRLKMSFAFATNLGRGTQIKIFPRSNPDKDEEIGAGVPTPIYRGNYSFEVEVSRGGSPSSLPFCRQGEAGSWSPCPLNLVDYSCRVLRCDSIDGLIECRPEECPR